MNGLGVSQTQYRNWPTCRFEKENRAQAPEAQDVEFAMIVRDGFSRKLWHRVSDAPNQRLDACDEHFARTRSHAVPLGPANLDMDAEAGFTAHDIRDAQERFENVDASREAIRG